MPRKRAKPTAVPVDVQPERRRVSQQDLLRLQLLSTQHRLAVESAKVATFELLSVVARLDPKGQIAALEAQRIKSLSDAGKQLEEYRALLRSVGDRVGCDLTNGCTIDPQTGEVTVLSTEKQESSNG